MQQLFRGSRCQGERNSSSVLRRVAGQARQGRGNGEGDERSENAVRR